MSDSGRDQRQLERSREDRLARAAQAAQTLSAALWETVHDELAQDEVAQDELGQDELARGELAEVELAQARTRRVAELAERLAEVARALATLARAQLPSPAAAAEPARAPAAAGASAPAPAKIEIRDRRAEIADQQRELQQRQDGPDPWIATIERRLERHARDGLPFAVLLLELADLDRLRDAEPPRELARLTAPVEAALAAELRPADALIGERPGRYWLLAPETDAAGARALAGRLVDAVRRAARHRGVPLQLAAGVAGCPGDGLQAARIAAQADVALYAARAAGRPLAAFDDPSR